MGESNYAGVDWAADKHDVRVADEVGEKLVAAPFAHDEKGLRGLCRTLLQLKVQLVPIERPDELLVERLLDAGLRVLAMHPNQVAVARGRFRVSGGKSDRFDAVALRELARTDSHRLRVLAPDSEPEQDAAGTDPRAGSSRARSGSADQPAARRARAMLACPDRPVPEARQPISLAFLERYPSPADARGLGEQRLRSFLARQYYSGGQTPVDLLSKLRLAPEGRVGEAKLVARRALELSLVAAITPLVDQIKQLDKQIASAVREHPDGAIFLSLFKDPRSVITAAQLLVEIGDCRARYPTQDALAADAGQAGVAIEAGRRKAASFPWGANKRLRAGFASWRTTRHWHPLAQDRYAAACARGHDHPHPLRTVGRAWSHVVWRCWQDHVPYDPARHRGLQQHCQVTIPASSGPVPT